MVKVSIISPCYNGESHLIPYINGLLSQTFSDVEFIFVNDGSTDNTEKIILSYTDKFQSKGWTFKYINLEIRGGQARAINQGLKIFTGEYLCCIDSDDIIMPTFLEEMILFLDNNKQYSIAFPWSEVIEENTNRHLKYFKRIIPEHTKDSLFDDFILQHEHDENYIQYTSFMIRSSAFLQIYPNKHIYEGLSGQNAQILLPILYNYRCGYVNKILYKAIARVNSDSRLDNLQDLINKTYSWEDIYCNVIKIIPNMPEYEKSFYFSYIKNYWENFRKNLIHNDNTPIGTKKESLLDTIFSVKNDYQNNIKRKIFTILGIKIKIRIKQKCKSRMVVESNPPISL